MCDIEMRKIDHLAHGPDGEDTFFSLVDAAGNSHEFRCGHAQLDSMIYALQGLAAAASQHRRQADSPGEPFDEAAVFQPTELRVLVHEHDLRVVLAAYGAEGRAIHLGLPAASLGALGRELTEVAQAVGQAR